MKIVFSIINGVLVILSLASLIYLFESYNLGGIILPAFLFLLFCFNILSIWRPFKIWISIIQILITLITIPILKIIYAVSIPLLIVILKSLELNIETEKFENLDWAINSLSTLIFVSAVGIIYFAYQNRKNSKI